MPETRDAVKESSFSDFSERQTSFDRAVDKIEKDTFLGRSPDAVAEGCPGPTGPEKQKLWRIQDRLVRCYRLIARLRTFVYL